MPFSLRPFLAGRVLIDNEEETMRNEAATRLVELNRSESVKVNGGGYPPIGPIVPDVDVLIEAATWAAKKFVRWFSRLI